MIIFVQNYIDIYTFGISFLSRYRKPTFPSIMGSVFGFLRFSMILRKHFFTSSVIGTIVSSLANMLGPVLGGLLFSLLGLNAILYISAVCFFLSAVLEIFIHIPFTKQMSDTTGVRVVFSDLQTSFHFIAKEQPTIWKLSAVYAFCCLLLT